MHRLCLALITVIACNVAPAARAQSPGDIVSWIYQSRMQPSPAQGLGYLMSPDRRAQYFSRRMVAFFEANESWGNDLSRACIDFALDIPGNDFDAAEIVRTLGVNAQQSDGRWTVTATFSNFGQPARIAYDFVAEDGFFRIDDIAGPGWRVSEIPCAARTTSAVSGSYCYVSGSDDLRLDLNADGAARFSLSSWQGGGHSCGVEGLARAGDGGWVFEDTQFGRACRLGIVVTAEQGIAISDPTHDCKMIYCGQRAALDGMHFPRSSQVDCARVPRQ